MTGQPNYVEVFVIALVFGIIGGAVVSWLRVAMRWSGRWQEGVLFLAFVLVSGVIWLLRANS